MSEPLVIVYWDSLGFTAEGEEWGNAVTTGGDPIQYDMTRAQFEVEFPENVWDRVAAGAQA